MPERIIEEIKQQLKPGWQGILYLKKGRFQIRSEEIEGTVTEIYGNEEGLIIEKERGGEVRVPYKKIVNFEPSKTVDEARKGLVVGFKGDLYLERGKVSGIVTGIYNGELVLDKPKVGKKCIEHKFKIIPITDIVDTHMEQIIVVGVLGIEESDKFYQSKRR